MAVTLAIRISDEATAILVHRFRNFGEDVYRAVGDVGEVSLEEVDRSTTSLAVRDVRRRDIGRVNAAIRRELRRHHFDDTATLVRL